jgi:hypothetical protein
MVVAEEMGKSSYDVRQITNEISQVMGVIGMTFHELDDSLLKLK